MQNHSENLENINNAQTVGCGDCNSISNSCWLKSDIIYISIYITCSSPHLILPHFYLENLLKMCPHFICNPLLPSSLQSSSARVSSLPVHLGPHIQWSVFYIPDWSEACDSPNLGDLLDKSPTRHPSSNHVNSICKYVWNLTLLSPSNPTKNDNRWSDLLQ